MSRTKKTEDFTQDDIGRMFEIDYIDKSAETTQSLIDENMPSGGSTIFLVWQVSDDGTEAQVLTSRPLTIKRTAHFGHHIDGWCFPEEHLLSGEYRWEFDVWGL